MFHRKCQRDIAALRAQLAAIQKKPITVTLNGHTLATAVVKDKAFDDVINEITHRLVYR